MNYLWAFMILTGVVFAAFHGTLPAVTQAALDSAKEADDGVCSDAAK